uniref:Protein FAR1-RELATED SEQUENCE n=1 Tax=Quercus lobata TaxID=97700 RepID=A0A7N2LM79_QUELO
MCLTEFVLHYETAGKKMREEELEEDFRCNQDAPPKIVQHSEILRHAASIYTRKIFYLFELEFASTLGVKIEEANHDGDIHTFPLIKEDHQRDAKKDSASCKYATSSSMSKEMLVTLRRNELAHSVYDIFSKSAATTRHNEMCKMKVKEMVDLIEKDMAILNMKTVVDANNDGLIDESETTTNGDGLMKSSHDDLPILDPPYVQQKGITNKRIKYNLEKRK